jgi:hypothetical protein
MALSERVWAAIVDNGASQEMVRAVVEADRRDEIARELKALKDIRVNNAARQRRYRSKLRLQRDVTKRDGALQKENPPHPLKKNTSPQVPKGTTPKRGQTAPFPFPSWMPMGAWRQFSEERRNSGRRLTRAAIEVHVAKLEELRRQGHDPERVIKLAIEKAWATFWPLPEGPTIAGSHYIPTTADELHRAAEFYEAHGNPQKAAMYQAKLQALRKEK